MQVIGGAAIPPSYSVWADGVWQIRDSGGNPDEDAAADRLQAPAPPTYRMTHERICQAPLWICALGQCKDVEDRLVQLAYVDLDSGSKRTCWTTTEDVSTRQRMTALASHGVSVNSVNVAQVIEYLAACRAANQAKLPMSVLYARSGLHEPEPGKWGFLLGEEWLPGDADTPSAGADPRRVDRFATAWKPRGNIDAWRAQWELLRQRCGAVFRWQVGASFAAPLLEMTGYRTFLVHEWGGSGNGKTARAKFAMSIWGNPKDLLRPLNMTENAAVETFRYFSNLPILFDELQMARLEKPFLIYALAGQMGKGRSTKTGGLQAEVKRFSSVVFTTGEEPLIGPNDLQGQANRVVEIRAADKVDGVSFRKLHDFCEAHHGAIGRAFIEQIVLPIASDPEQRAALKTRYEEFLEEIVERTGVESVNMAAIAAGALGQFLAEYHLHGLGREAACQQAVDDACVVSGRITASIPPADRALRVIRDDFSSNPSSYIDLADPGALQKFKQAHDVHGFIYTDAVGFTSSFSARLLTAPQHGLPPRRVWSDLADRGLLIVDGGSDNKTRLQARRRLPDGSWNRLYTLRRAALEEQIVVPLGETAPAAPTDVARIAVLSDALK